jgi:hypothetical protein
VGGATPITMGRGREIGPSRVLRSVQLGIRGVFVLYDPQERRAHWL